MIKFLHDVTMYFLDRHWRFMDKFHYFVSKEAKYRMMHQTAIKEEAQMKEAGKTSDRVNSWIDNESDAEALQGNPLASVQDQFDQPDSYKIAEEEMDEDSDVHETKIED